jgi:predicted DNA-binding transcriptional regulator AlpA
MNTKSSGEAHRAIDGHELSSSMHINDESALEDHKEARMHRALANFQHLPDAAYVRQPVVQALFSISSATVWRYVKSGRLPAPDRIGTRAIGWRVGGIRKALEQEQ